MVDNARKLSALRGDMIGLGNVPNPFEEWLSTLEAMIAALKMVATITPVISLGSRGGTYSLADIADTEAARSAIGAASMIGNYSMGDIADVESARSRIGAATINYNINAAGIGDQQIAAVVQNAIQDLNRYGSSTTYAGAI